ncbi:MAG: hypothetical protein HYU51_16010 [Candidatus Rokubacteria bacterium]|nr:hypothetical protein [Candidatus Rokubacteria bacterium]
MSNAGAEALAFKSFEQGRRSRWRVSVSEAIESFLRQMAADGRSRLSIESYRRLLVSLAGSLGEVRVGDAGLDELNTYLISATALLKADGTAKRTSTVNRAKSVIRSVA